MSANGKYTQLEIALAEQLHNALMYILCDKNEEWERAFVDEDGDPLAYEDGGNLSCGGEMSGFGEFEFDFQKAKEVLDKTSKPLPEYGSAPVFRFDLSAFATREGCDAVMARAGLVRCEDGAYRPKGSGVSK